MDLQAMKITFVQEFLRLQNEEIISGIEKLIKNKKPKFFEMNHNKMNMKQFNDEIDQALDDSQNDRVINQTDLKSKIKKWI